MIEVNPRVKDALRSGAYRKNYRINVLNDDGTTDFTLNNTELVSESVKIDERMCSGDTLKFGLCEGSSIEFQYFNHDNVHNGNIRGRRIQVFVDVQYKDADGDLDWCAIPLGFFDIQECSTQFSTGIIKAVGYNKLRSDYLDQKCNDAIIEAARVGDPGQTGASIGSMLQKALEGYAVEPKCENVATFNVGLDRVFINKTWLADSGAVTMLYKKNPDGTFIPINDDPSAGYLDNVFLWPITAIVMIPTEDAYGKHYYRAAADETRLMELYEYSIRQSGVSDYYAKITTESGDEYIPIVEYYQNYNVETGGIGYELQCSVDSEGHFPIVHSEKKVFSEKELGVVRTDYAYQSRSDLQARFQLMSFPFFWVIDRYLESSDPYSQPRDPVTIALEHQSEWESAFNYFDNIFNTEHILWAERRIDTEMESIVFTEEQAETLPDVTLRELQSAVYETVAEFGQLDRVTDLFGGVRLSRERLFPADDLYPSDTLYPQSVSESTFKSMYEKLWTDSVGEQTFRKLYITYKGLDDQQREKEFVLERTVNADGTTDYYCDDNWLFKNLIWTAEQVGAYADAMVLKMRGIKWFPFEMWSAGLPYIEVGDELEINTKDGTYTSYVLQRSLNGIQNLKDTYINGSLDIF